MLLWRREPYWTIVFRSGIECFCCMMFHFIGSVAPTAVANGLALMVLVYYSAKVSGAHLNPAVTLVFCLLGHSTPIELLFYWIAQVAGCVIGALWIAMLIPDLGLGGRPAVEGSGCFEPSSNLSRAQVFGWEAIGTFCFIVPIFSVVWYTQTKSGYGNTGPLIVGMSLMTTALAVAPRTGAALNPARALGSAIVFDCRVRGMLWCYILGEFLGAFLVPLAIIPCYGISGNPWYFAIEEPDSPSPSQQHHTPASSTPVAATGADDDAAGDIQPIQMLDVVIRGRKSLYRTSATSFTVSPSAPSLADDCREGVLQDLS